MLWSEVLVVGERESVASFNSLRVSEFTFSLLKLEGVFLHLGRAVSSASALRINCGFYGSVSLWRSSGTHGDQDADSEEHKEAQKLVLVRCYSHIHA